jgi:hypothetical protein
MVRLTQDALLLQSIGTSSHGFDGQTKKTGENCTGNALLDLVRFNGFDTLPNRRSSSGFFMTMRSLAMMERR